VVDRKAIQARDGKIWDNLHVWAPSIVRQGITYYMFYTGVQLDTIIPPPNLVTSEIQRIGVATSVDLNSWTQDPTPVYFNKKASWTFQDSTQNKPGSWQFRDPFVMDDPENPGRSLLYFVSIDSALSQFVVGVARAPGSNLRQWGDVGPLLRTSQSHMGALRDESPHAFFRRGNWWLLYTSNRANGDTITYSLNSTSPASLDTSTWSSPARLKSIVCGEHGFPTSLDQWHGTEYLRIGANEYLSAWADNLVGGTQIQFAQIRAPDPTCPTDTLRLDCPDVATAVDEWLYRRASEPASLELAGACPVHESAPLRLALRHPTQVHVAIYDVFGRRVKTLFVGKLEAGITTLTWDGRSQQGALASSGVYFARATYESGRRVTRIPLIR